MLTTGVRTPVGIKIFGDDLKQIEAIGSQLEEILRTVPGTRSVFAERAAGGYFVDFDLDRQALARFGLSVGAVQDVIMSAVGGENVTTTIEGRARYPVNVRYPRGLRDDVTRLGQVLVMTPSGAQVPLAQLARLRTVAGPAMIRNENGMMAGYVFVDMTDSDVGGYVERARAAVASRLSRAERLLDRMERPVREHAAGAGAAEDRRAHHAVPDLLPALHEHEVRVQGRCGHARGTVLGRRGCVADVSPRLQRVDRGMGRHDRPDGPGCGDGRLHAAVSGSLLRGGEAAEPTSVAGRTEGRDHPWRGQTRSAEDDDRRRPP